MSAPNKAELLAALDVVRAVTEAIREAGEIPEGTLYALLMDRFDYPTFERMLALVLHSKLVTNEGHLLRWVGPKGGAQ
jgi:hypothetical protein